MAVALLRVTRREYRWWAGLDFWVGIEVHAMREGKRTWVLLGLMQMIGAVS